MAERVRRADLRVELGEEGLVREVFCEELGRLVNGDFPFEAFSLRLIEPGVRRERGRGER